LFKMSATMDMARIISEKVRQAMSNKFLEIYKTSLTESEYTPEKVMSYLNTSANIFHTVHEDTSIHLETAPVVEETPEPNLKWIAPMELVRTYVQNFVPRIPYDEVKDELISTDLAPRFQKECGAVVYSKHSKTKQLGFLYNCVVNFCKSLEGSVLVIGDNGGAIAHRTNFRYHYTMYRGEPDLSLLNECKRPGCIIYQDEFQSLFHRRHFDHIVVFLYSYDFEFPSDSRVHYLSLLSGNGGISNTLRDSEFSIGGKLVSLHPNPVGDFVVHTSFFPVYDPLDHFVVWYTDLFPNIKTRSASLTPLTNLARLGPQNQVLISDKSDGEVFYLESKNAVVSIVNAQKEIIDQWVNTNSVDQILIIEKVGKVYVVVEPLFYAGVIYFGMWVDLGEYFIREDFRFKTWYAFPDDLDWESYATSREGVVFKGRSCPIGFRDHAFRRLSTYYLKLKNRVSYEDYVDKIWDRTKTVYVFRGMHNIYEDHDNVYESAGVYEINFETLSLFRRRREKKFADMCWYVEAVTTKVDFSKVFSIPICIVQHYEQRDQGLRAMYQVKSQIVQESLVLDRSPGQIIVKFSAEIGSLLLFASRMYSVISNFEGMSVANLMA